MILLDKFGLAFCRGFHSNSRRKLPVVKYANSRVARAQKQKLIFEDTADTSVGRPSGQVEPFPYAVTEENKEEIVKRLITPLHDTPYEEQLSAKENFCKNALRYLAQELYKNGTPIRLNVSRLPCHVNPIVRAPELHNYRNKDEFSIWEGHDGETKTVGFFAFSLGKYSNTVCIEPNGCSIMKEETLKMAGVLQEFIRNHATLDICKNLGHEGGWRRFIVRNNSQGELMVAGIASPTTLRVQQIIDERKRFRDFIVERSNEVGLKLKSLYFQPCPQNNCMHKDVPYELLFGDEALAETINGFKLVISPESAMHTSSKGAEVLFNTVVKTAVESFRLKELRSKPIIIDANCGIGALGFHFHDIGEKVIGVDISSQAIDNAIHNSEKNNIGNYEAICANLELVLGRILDKYSKYKTETMILCNPTSSNGLHHSVVEAIRGCREVTKIIYITCKPDREKIVDNLMTLCEKSQGNQAPPFIPVSATPVDMYPQLNACELVIALERIK